MLPLPLLLVEADDNEGDVFRLPLVDTDDDGGTVLPLPLVLEAEGEEKELTDWLDREDEVLAPLLLPLALLGIDTDVVVPPLLVTLEVVDDGKERVAKLEDDDKELVLPILGSIAAGNKLVVVVDCTD